MGVVAKGVCWKDGCLGNVLGRRLKGAFVSFVCAMWRGLGVSVGGLRGGRGLGGGLEGGREGGKGGWMDACKACAAATLAEAVCNSPRSGTQQAKHSTRVGWAFCVLCGVCVRVCKVWQEGRLCGAVWIVFAGMHHCCVAAHQLAAAELASAGTCFVRLCCAVFYACCQPVFVCESLSLFVWATGGVINWGKGRPHASVTCGVAP